MTEQEFKDALKKVGYDEEGINWSIWTYHKTKEHSPELTFEEWFDGAKKVYEEHKDDNDDFITVD